GTTKRFLSGVTSRPTRRELLKTGAAGAAALGVSSLGLDSLLTRADAATGGHCGRLSDIEHVVILVQENRSFDHYFGSYRGVTGFDDPSGLFAQPGYDQPGYGGVLYPFHIDSTKNGDCTNDIDHGWGPQHRVWDSGAMDNWVREHLKDDGANGPMTMGYYRRADLPFYYWLADNFTICDRYFCSVIGPTVPNRLYIMSGTIDPDGQNGGPLLETLVS